MHDFRRLQVWDKSHGLTLRIYELTSDFPREEIYGLTSQIRRACASIPTNTAEGCGRETPADFARFLQIATGSASETEYLIQLAHDLKYFNTDQYVELTDEIVSITQVATNGFCTFQKGFSVAFHTPGECHTVKPIRASYPVNAHKAFIPLILIRIHTVDSGVICL